MEKNIVIFADGTGQDGGMRPEQVMSNVYKLYRACRVGPTSSINPAEQVAFYDAGLGTDSNATGLTRFWQRYQKFLSTVTGRGITINIAECYEFIINHYSPGDRIFLFGFSRGAYTVRSVANLLMLCGVPTKGDGVPLQKFRSSTRAIADAAVNEVLEHGAGHPREKYENERFELARRFRERYGSQFGGTDTDIHRSNVAAHFVGVFDSVAALGLKPSLSWLYRLVPLSIAAGAGLVLALAVSAVFRVSAGYWLPMYWVTISVAGTLVWALLAQSKSARKVIHNYPNTGEKRTHYARWKGENFDRVLSRHVSYARSANAIDELRADFDRCPWGKTGEDVPFYTGELIRLRQLWFAGNHSDIGGSYPEAESRLSDVSLVWMIEEALSLPEPLKIGPVYVNGARLPKSAEHGDALRLYPSPAGVQHCEVAAMRDLVARLTPWWCKRLTAGRSYTVKARTIKPDAVLHQSVLDRLALAEVPQCAGSGPYRPDQLRAHSKCQSFYDAQDTDASAQA